MVLKTNVEAWALSFSALVGLGLAGCGGKASDEAGEVDAANRVGPDVSTSPQAGGNGGGDSSGVDSSAASGVGGSLESSTSAASNTTGVMRGAGGAGGTVTVSTGSVDTTATGTASTTGGPPTGSSNGTCTDPVNIAGTVMCAEGFYHRTDKSACPSTLPRDTVIAVDEGWHVECTQDSDCTERPYGHCEDTTVQVLQTGCKYGCVEDSDCGEGEICECGAVIGTCVAAQDCEVDGDCPDGSFCASYESEGSCGWERLGYACQSEQDACVGPSDCGDDGCVRRGNTRACESFPWICGRPFIVQGSERRAAVTSTEAWLPHEPLGHHDTVALDPVLAEELARRWADVALMEHASVAAFARFTLQLLSLGAPADLVLASQRAALDEVEHARVCFAIASRFAGRPLGPSALPASDVLCAGELELEQVLELVIREGCFGETLAALAASEGALSAVDPVIRRALGTITRDEREHAALAWRTVKWALECGDDELCRWVADCFERVRSEYAAAGAEPSTDPRFAEHGIVVGPVWERIQREAIDRVIAPMAAELVAGAGATRARPEPQLAALVGKGSARAC